jgi:hypothetical protein
MIEQLIEKITFAQNHFQSVSGQLLGFDSYKEDGKYYYVLPERIQCYDLDLGRTYTLEKGGQEKDWYLFRLLYLKSHNEKKFRIDVPIKQEILTFNGDQWQYTDVMRPGPDNGQYHTGVWVEQDLIKAYELILNDFYELLSAAKEIALENNAGIPLFTGKPGEDSEGIYFLKNFSEWDYPIQYVINNMISRWTHGVNLPFFTEEYKADWSARARAKWETLL